MTAATKLGRVLSGVEGARPARTVAEVDATVAAYRAACGLTAEEAQDVANIRAELGKREAGR